MKPRTFLRSALVLLASGLVIAFTWAWFSPYDAAGELAAQVAAAIYERIREEQRGGRGMLAAIHTGFKRAMATILNANATHLIAALVLFELGGSGPVRGFAVALGCGIITSFFTSVVVTQLIVVTWLNTARPRSLTI
jgi:hypothetical protein